MKRVSTWVALSVGLAVALPLFASQTQFWQLATFDDFLQGTLHGISASKDGELSLAPSSHAIFSPEETLALSLAADRNHNLYIGTGHAGKVYRVGPQGKGKVLFQAQEPEIFALAVGPDGNLYAGSSPDGKIYRISADGKSSVFYDPRTKYIWSLRFDKEGRLYAATGDHGTIIRIGPDGKGETFYDTKQMHVMCLAFDHEGNLLAGTEPDGLIYRITPQGKGFILYKSSLPEVHALATDSEGRVYAALLGTSAGKGTPQIFTAPPPTGAPANSVTTVTVTASTDDEAQKPPVAPNKPSAKPSFNRTAPQAGTIPMTPIAGGQGALVEILPDNSVETLWSSGQESIFGLVVRGSDLLFSTDQDGRIFDLHPSREGSKVTLLTETREALATHLLLEGQDLYIATSNVAKLFRLGAESGDQGSYESPVKDTHFVSRWGALAWRADVPKDCSLVFYSRSGNSESPDSTWSDWSGPYRDSRASAIQSPPARYIQWKAEFKGSGGKSPVLDDVTLAYLNQNLPPEIRTVNVSTAEERSSASQGSNGSSSSNLNGVTVSLAAPPGFSQTQPRPPAKVPTVISWQADDPNGDPLVYSLYLKSTDEQEWHLVKDHLRENNYTLEPDALADGEYVARVVASDEDSNPPGQARQAEMLSAPFWIDNSPPQFRVLSQQVTGMNAEVHFEVETERSPLREAEVSVDGKPWIDAASDDGIVDSRRETFTVKLTALAPGEHVVALRAYDTAGNAGVGQAVIRIAGAPR